MKISGKLMFTIITISYNAEKEIKKTMESILNQDFSEYEYILVDGASTDNTMKIAKNYIECFGGKLTIISEPDKGIYDAMNKGIAKANGEYIAFINAGDELNVGALSKLKYAIDIAEEKPDIIYGDAYKKYRNRDRVVTKRKKATNPITENTLKRGMGVIHQSMFTHRSLFEKVGKFNLEYSIGADWDFLIRCVKSGAKLQHMDYPISIFDTDGVSSKSHNFQRHIIRKNNNMYSIFDLNFVKDVFNPGALLQRLVGDTNYQKIRYWINRRDKK